MKSLNDKKVNDEWINTWERIFKGGVPQDLLNPYGRFDIVLNKLLDSGSKKVLDVAMGAGRHAVILASTKMQVYGFDLSKSALKLAKEELENRNLSCQMKQGDMFGLYPYEDDFFDGVIAIQAIYHGYRKHMIKAINEIHRVLKKGGIFGFTVSLNKKRSTMGSINKKIKKIAPNTYMALKGREKGIPHYYPNSDELLKILKPRFSDINIMVDELNKYLLIICRSK